MSDIQASLSFNTNASGAGGESKKRSRKGGTKDWDHPHSEPRKGQSTGTYPDYFSWKTRSGHVFQLDDTQGGETVTLQHRGGTAIQIAPDGTLNITAHNGKYEIVFGEDRMTVSGAQDITVKGDASMRVYGDYNVTCQKDYNLTVLGNFNLVAKNHNRHVLGNIDTQARNENKKLMGSSSKIARGAIAYVSKGSATLASHSDQVHIGGGSGVNMYVDEGDITSNIEKGSHYMATKDGSIHQQVDGQDGHIRTRSMQGKIEMKSKDDYQVKSENGNMKFTADNGDIGHEATTGSIESKAPSGGIKHSSKNYSVNASQSAEVLTQQKLDLRASGDASLHGSTTHVSGQSVNVKGQTTTNIDGPSGLSLNGLLSQVMPAIGLQIPFDFGQFTDAETKEGESQGVPAPDRPAGRDEADNWH
jgi:hypothetical protein